MKKRLTATLLTLAMSTPALADDWGLFAGVDVAKPAADGKVAGNKLSLDNELRANGYLAVEHGIIFLPNVKLAYSDLGGKGKTNSTDVTLGMSSFDGILYYQLFDNGLFETDFGLNFKYVSGDLHTTSNTHFSSTIPQAYGAAKLHIPNTGISVFSELTAGSVTDDEIVDGLIGLSYAFNPDGLSKFKLRGGYRYQEVKLKEDVKLNTEFEGFFVGAEMRF